MTPTVFGQQAAQTLEALQQQLNALMQQLRTLQAQQQIVAPAPTAAVSQYANMLMLLIMQQLVEKNDQT